MHENILDALRRGAHDEALALARQATEADPGDARGHRLMAQALRLSGDQRGAVKAIDRAIAIEPEDSGLHLARATMLVGSRELDLARQDLDRALELDPNQLGAYVMQADLALGRGDVEEADRLARVATRIAPEHPLLQAIQAMIALARGEREAALTLVSAALGQMPDDPQVLNAAAFTYMANGNLAFAEQAFRRLRELRPNHHALRRALAEMLFRQERYAEALEELEPLLALQDAATPENLRFGGLLALGLGDARRALEWLRPALGAMPGDWRTLDLAMKAWSRLADPEGARNTLEALLSTTPQIDLLWRARLSVETAPGAAREVLARWQAALPDSMEAMESEVRLELATGGAQSQRAALEKILERTPGHLPSIGQLMDLMAAEGDHAGAVGFAREKLEQLVDAPDAQRQLQAWMAMASDGAGAFADAVGTWASLHAEMAGRLLQPPAATAADAPRRAAAGAADDAPAIAFLAGPPGSGVEYVARLLDGVVPAFRSDRARGAAPADGLQNFSAIQGLADGSVDPAAVAAQWRAALPARGVPAGAAVIDWLLWWDNALLDVLRPHLPQARLLLALRDPRDMLLNWLAFGGAAPFRLDSPQAAADWLAGTLDHVALLHEQDLHPHVLLRLDEVVNDPQAMAKLVGGALGLELPEPPPGLFQGRRFAAGRWRDYAGVLGGPFATLAPVALRLGYPDS